MAYSVDTLTLKLGRAADSVSPVDFAKRGFHAEVTAKPAAVREMARILLEEEFYQVFVTAVHMKPALVVVYQFARFDTALRINIRVPVGEDKKIPTIADIFHGADWHERETRDFYGVVFDGHPNLIPLILCEEDVDLMPLLKDEKSLKDAEKVTTKEASSKKPEKKRE